MTKAQTLTADAPHDLAALAATVHETRGRRDTLRATVARLERSTTDGGDPSVFYDQLAELPALKRALYRAEAETARAETALAAARAAKVAAVLADRRQARRTLIGQFDADLAIAAQTLARIVAYDAATAQLADGATVDAPGWTLDLLGVDSKLAAWRRFQRESGWLD